MENFFYDDDFHQDLDSLIDKILDLSEEVEDLPDDWEIECIGSNLESIVTLSAGWITERIDEDRFSENNVDSEVERIENALFKNVNFDLVNSLIPKLYYPNRSNRFKITKKDLLDWVK